jgi:hypothetical protein
MATLTLTLGRDSLDLPALVITGAPPAGGAGFRVDTLTRPARVWERERAASQWVHGAVQTRATLEVASFGLTVHAQAASAAALDALRDELDDALSQWTFPLTVNESGVSKVYDCDCADVSWQDYDSGMADAHLSTATVTVPCYPLPIGTA